MLRKSGAHQLHTPRPTMPETEPAAAPSPEANPFDRASDAIRDCWALGYHDGLTDLDPAVGIKAIEVFAVGARDRVTNEDAAKLAQLRADLDVASVEARRLTQERTAQEAHVLPEFGPHAIGWLQRAVPFAYIAMSIAAMVAEFFLSGQTISAAVGSEPTESMKWIMERSTWALIAMFCLLGLSIKVAIDIKDGRAKPRLETKVLTALTLLTVVLSYFFLAQLRSSIAASETVANLQYSADSAGVALSAPISDATARDAADLGVRAGRTFMLVTLAFPLFAALCVIVGMDQLRDHRNHGPALASLAASLQAHKDATAKESRLKHELTAFEERLRREGEALASTGDLAKRAALAYDHGFASGAAALAAQLAPLGIYRRLTRDLGARLSLVADVAPNA